MSSRVRPPAARMLVVDDDPRNRRLLADYLRAEGYAVREAEDGAQALRMVHAELPDVVLLDVMMPGMSGHRVCEILKHDPLTRLCQIMLVTALSSTPDKVEGLDLGADDYLPKPVRREEFLAKVRALLRVRRVLVELEEARSELARRNEELQLKKTLAQSLVHDLKTPLAAVLGNLDLLERHVERSRHKLVERSKEGARRMLKMILNLLDVEGLEEGKLRPALARTDARAVALETIQEAEVPARKQNVALVLDAPEPVWVEADPVLLRRVVDNLVANALHYSPDGGRVELVVRDRAEGVEIVISDEGCGIPEEHREAIFEKYAQLRSDVVGGGANKGLGLTFCRLAVEAHGGSIWVEEARGGGARFRTMLPSLKLAEDGTGSVQAVKF